MMLLRSAGTLLKGSNGREFKLYGSDYSQRMNWNDLGRS